MSTFVAAVILQVLVALAPFAPTRGALVIVGGGGTPDAAVKKAIALSGKEKAHVLVFGQASSREGAGESSVEMFVGAGAGSGENANLEDPAKVKAAIEKADIIWFPGGDQNRLMEALKKADLVGAIKKRFETGAVVGGTSAGAAVISDVMITGKADLESIKAKTTETAEGLGLLKGIIVDQHFHARRRFNRLLSLVLDRPKILGIGIDEGTAMVLVGKKIEVVGKSSILIVDARKSAVAEAAAGDLAAATEVKLHVVRTGQTFDLDTDPY